jgi:hypothetical protein
MKNRLFTLAGLLVVLAVLGRFYAEPLYAQVRAALVQNTDEPGRNPFVVSSTSTTGFWVVPAGKRYVIETLSASCSVDNTGFLSSIRLSAVAGGAIQVAQIPANFQDTNGFVSGHAVSLWFGTGSMHVYADPGTGFAVVPSSNFSQTGAVVRDCNISVSGYAINNP